MNVMLPGTDGWEVCRRLRSDAELVVVFLSARDEPAARIGPLAAEGRLADLGAQPDQPAPRDQRRGGDVGAHAGGAGEAGGE